MTAKKTNLLVVSVLFLFHSLFAQNDPVIKFGKVSAADFQVSSPKYDSGSNAVIIADIGTTTFEGNRKGFLSLVFTRLIRVKILNKNGFDIADYNINLANSRNGVSEIMTELKGTTFNLENGVIKESKLDDKSVFPTKISSYHDRIKFSMPGLKEGSVYDLFYKIKSNYYDYPFEWTFQHKDFPCLWSEYETIIPTMYHYLIKTTGDRHFDVETRKLEKEEYSVTRSMGALETDEMMNVYTPVLHNKWVMKNVPAIREQPYISTMGNYLPRISFKLNFFQQDEEAEKHLEMTTWDTLSHKMLVAKDFGFELNQDNHWMDDELMNITAGALNSEDEVRRIYKYVRDNFRCTSYDDIYISSSLKDVFKSHSGSVGELNLLLVALLRHKNIQADPAIISTRENGVATFDLPLRAEYNYVICVANPSGKMILLDASRPYNAFGKLPEYCNNWGARVINDQNSLLIKLIPDSTSNKNVTNVMFINDEKGVFTGSVKTVFGEYESLETREKVKSVSEKDYFKELSTETSSYEISNIGFDSLLYPDEPLVLHYDMELKGTKGSDIIYFTPMVADAITKNPFSAAERQFPVEMPYKKDYTYLLSMEIPNGFQIDELPKSARVNFGDKQGIFEYLIQQNPDNIQMRVHLKLNQATFMTDEYNSLRDFFAFVVKKESEQIVFKKIK